MREEYVTEEKRKELAREEAYIMRTGEMGGLNGVRVRGGPNGRGGQWPVEKYSAHEVADAWGVTRDTVNRLGAAGLLGKRYRAETPGAVIKYAKGSLRRALQNPVVLQAVADGRMRKQASAARLLAEGQAAERRHDATDEKGK